MAKTDLYEEITDQLPKPDDTIASMYIFLLLAFFILINVPVRILLRRINSVFPQTLVMGTISIIAGVLIMHVHALRVYWHITRVCPTDLIYTFVPIFIVSASFRMDYHVLLQCIPQVLTIVAFSALLTPLMLACVLSVLLHPDWTFVQALQLALILVPIDPHFVTHHFRHLQKYRFLGTMMEAESVVLLVPVFICYRAIMVYEKGEMSTWTEFAKLVLVHHIGVSLLTGLVLGKVLVHLTLRLYNQPLHAVLVTMCIAYISYFITRVFLNASAPLCMLCIGCMFQAEKHRLTPEVEECMKQFWTTVYAMTRNGLFMISCTELTIYIIYFFEPKMMYTASIIYFADMLMRFGQFSLIRPVLNQMSYDLSMKSCFVLSWSNIKGPINVMFLLLVLTLGGMTHELMPFLLELLCDIVLSQYINAASMRLILKIIGISELTAARRTNMNNCMRFVGHKRECIIDTMLTNRYLANANWAIVREETLILHPYDHTTTVAKQEDDDNSAMRNYVAVCQDCGQEVYYEIGAKEMADLKREAIAKVLKAKKMSISKEYDIGYINKKCMQTISQKLETMIESRKQTKHALDLHKYIQPNRYYVHLRKFLRVCLLRKPTPPTQLFRSFCFYLTMHVAYDCIVYSVTLANAIFCIWNSNRCCTTWMPVYHIVIWCVFAIDMLVKIIGFSREMFFVSGFDVYFRYVWNAIDFGLLALGTLAFITLDDVFAWMHTYFIPTHRTLAVLRLVGAFRLLGTFGECLVRRIDRYIDVSITTGYGMAHAWCVCLDDLITNMDHVIELKVMRELFTAEIVQERHVLAQQMGVVQTERPWIPITVKTRQTIRRAHAAMKTTLHVLKQAAFVDVNEYNILVKQMFEKEKILHTLKFVQPSAPRAAFKEIPWMTDNDEVVEFLFKHVQTATWHAGDVVFERGKVATGIYIVVTGMVHLQYQPTATTGKNGMMPIVDFLHTTEYARSYDDVVTSGLCIGELSALTNRPYDGTVRAEAPCQMYFLPTAVLKAAMKLDANPVSGLEARIWKEISMQLAVCVMMDADDNVAFTQEQVLMMLAGAFVPNLRCYKSFVVCDSIRNVIVIEGAVSDSSTWEEYIAPVLIPESVKRLQLHQRLAAFGDNTVHSRLFIVPVKGVHLMEIMEFEEENADLISTVDSNCLMRSEVVRKRQHSIRSDESTVGPEMGSGLLGTSSAAIRDYNWKADDKVIINLDETKEGDRASDFEDIFLRFCGKEEDEEEDDLDPHRYLKRPKNKLSVASFNRFKQATPTDTGSSESSVGRRKTQTKQPN